MRLAGTQYTLKNRAFEIYLSGCTLHCKNCHNPELWDFSFGEPLDEDKILDKIKENDNMIDEIWILGGEPLDQEWIEFVGFVTDLGLYFPKKKLVLFTGYDFEDIVPYVFCLFDKIKFGRYVEELKTEGEELASSNQGVWYNRRSPEFKE